MHGLLGQTQYEILSNYKRFPMKIVRYFETYDCCSRNSTGRKAAVKNELRKSIGFDENESLRFELKTFHKQLYLYLPCRSLKSIS